MPRRTSSSSPRTWRSVPANFCTRLGGPVWAGLPALTHAHESGHRAQSGFRAVHTRAPSSISAALKRGVDDA
ncbi:Uncharacterised protein [Mycobacteroides abscessus subsp. abscessus]|nr:Uncharacterised protein [Mycobacteroides abscessus subsp. abscessus]